MSSISSVAAGAGASIITNGSGSSTSGKPGQTVEPAGSASSSVPLLYYSSPRIYVDPQYGQVVYDYRDPTTGLSTQQVPSRQALDAYTRSSQTPVASTGAVATTATTSTSGQATSESASNASAPLPTVATSTPVASASTIA